MIDTKHLYLRSLRRNYKDMKYFKGELENGYKIKYIINSIINQVNSAITEINSLTENQSASINTLCTSINRFCTNTSIININTKYKQIGEPQ